jgi:Holliday junction resolvase
MSARGNAVERKVAKFYRDQGYVVASLRHEPGAGDHLAARAGEPLLYIESKGNAGNAFMNFRPRERAEVRGRAAKAGATPLLAHWPPRQPLRILPVSEWP